MSDYQATGIQFDSGIRSDQVSLNFYLIEADKMSTQLAWELNTSVLALDWPPDSDICSELMVNYTGLRTVGDEP